MSEQDTKQPTVTTTKPAAAPLAQPRAVEPELDELQKLLAFFEENGTSLLIAVGIAVVAVLGVTLYRRHVEKTQAEASAMLYSVKSIQDLDNLVSRYSSTSIAPLASLKLAKSYFDSGNYEMALSKYDEFRQKYPEHPFALVAEVGKMHCAESMGQTEQALTQFSAFLSQHPKHFLAAEALFGKGRCLETLGRYAEAKTLYEDFIAADPKGQWAMRAEEQLAGVKRKLGGSATAAEAVAPAGTNAPAPMLAVAETNAPASATNVPALAPAVATNAPAAK
jgi:predicted negative regulator of RcsB-dependent stress response